MQYYPQIQGQLWVTGRAWCDWLSYHDKMAPVLIRVPRDEEYITTLSSIVTQMCDELDVEEEQLK